MVVSRHFLSSVLLLCFLGFQPLLGQNIAWKHFPDASLWDYASSYFIRENNSPMHPRQQLARSICHLASAPSRRKYLVSSIRYYANSDSTFHQARLITSGDVSLNPGPMINSSKCSVCTKTIAKNHRALSCDQCEHWCHMKCGQVKLSQYKYFQQKDQFNWICPACLLSVLPFTDVSIPTDDNAHVKFDNPANTTTHGTDRNIPTFYGDLYTKLKGHGLKIAHLNVRSLLGKISEIKLMLSESKLDILAITETHLDDETPIEYVMITGYQVARLDRKDQEGGGCIIYYSESLYIHERDDLKTDIEAIWIDVTMKSQKLLLGCVYRPPDDYSFYNKFYSLLEHSLRNRKNVVILGDLNSDLIAKGYEGRRLLRILSSLDLHSVIKDPTRTTVTSVFYPT